MTFTFWADLNRRLEDPGFHGAYVETSMRIQAVDNAVNAFGESPEGTSMRLHEMARIAATVRGTTPLDSPARQASVEFSAELARLRADGVPYAVIEQLTGLSRGTVIARLRRHGHRSNPPSQNPYTGTVIPTTNNASKCKRGHDTSGVGRYKNGECKQCAKDRVAGVRAAKKARRNGEGND